MTHKDYNNEMLRQVRTCVSVVNDMANNVSVENLKAAVPEEAIQRIRKVILTGCGDSYCAGIAAAPVFERAGSKDTTGMFSGLDTVAMRNIEFTRYYDTYRGWWREEGNAIPLVCGVSISGAVRRVTEAMERTNKYAGESVAFTDNPASDFAKAAKYQVPLNVPKNTPAPCVTSYLGSTFGLMAFGLRVNVVKGNITEAQEKEMRDAMVAYANMYTPEFMETLEKKMFEITEKWIAAGVDNMDFVGDDQDYATAFFNSAKMVESFGGLTTIDDSEDWNHINYFIRTPEKVGTTLIANTTSPSFGRQLENVYACIQLGRPTVVITDGDASLFPKADNVDIITLPKPEYPWINPLMQHVPMDFLAAFFGLLKGIPDFRPDSPLHELDRDAKRFRQSEVVII